MAAVSERLRTFLQQRLTSLDQIEVVLLLRGDRERSWTATEVAGALRTAPESAAMRLFLLASAGLILFEASSVPRYRYSAADPDTDALIQELAETCAGDRAAVASIVDNGTRDPIRSFADAFKLKK
jgi:hypothetical protein